MSPEVALLDALFEHPHDYVALIREGTILRMNVRLAALLGHSRPTLEGSTILRFVAADDLPVVETIIKNYRAGRLSDDYTVRLVAPDGSLRSVRWTVRRVTYAGQPAVLAVGHDLTDLLRLEAELYERTAALDRARASRAEADHRDVQELQPEARSRASVMNDLKGLDGLKTDLISTIGHELRTPLVSIRGYADLLAGAHLGPLAESQRQAVEVMLRNVDRLMQIIENILTYSALENGQVSWHPQTVNLTTALASVVRLSQPAAEQRQVCVELDLPAEGLNIEADPHHLATLVHQLLSNAIKFNQVGGRVFVRARRTAGGAEISVSDTGVGIAPEQLSKIFERFYQVDGSRTRRYAGLGLGLALVHGIVTLHQGGITVESKPGEGSTFVVWLPERGPTGSGHVQAAE